MSNKTGSPKGDMPMEELQNMDPSYSSNPLDSISTPADFATLQIASSHAPDHNETVAPGTQTNSAAPIIQINQNEIMPTPQNNTPAPTQKPMQPQVPESLGHQYPTDPTEIRYAEAGKDLMKKLQETTGYEKLNIKARKGYDYLIAINKTQHKNTVTVFCIDEEGNYTRPYLSMVCSAGNDTPLGVFNTQNRYSWHTLMGPCYGQYCTRIVGGVLFHSVPYTTRHKYDLNYTYYNKLGSLASAGCIRLPCNDSKWIYDNCPLGTTVVIYSDSSSVGPLGQPTPLRIDPNDILHRGWDPTDPDKANPWGSTYKTGYTIRSQIARSDYQYAMSHGIWSGSINPPEASTPIPDIPVVTETPQPENTPVITDVPAPTDTPTPTPEPSVTSIPDATSWPLLPADPTENPSNVPVPPINTPNPNINQ